MASGARLTGGMALEVFLGCGCQRRDGTRRIKLALEGPRWHSHLGGWHAILTTSVVDRVLHAVGQAQFATN